ncbi:MAG: hypothetical protein H8M99_13160 [Gloeobacteraceae cyanobacterium ES-bin-144]|nr:hypothetical protein [Verrucomicrobiales bacterium]
MKSRITPSIVTALAATAITIGFAMSAPYEKGQQVEPFTAKDQHEQAFSFKPMETRYLLVSHDMETGKKANVTLTALGKDYLGSKKAVYMANIFGMPGIGRMFAMPKMKKYNHRIILADEAALIAHFPAQAGKVTVLTLSGGKIQSVAYWTPGAEGVESYMK